MSRGILFIVLAICVIHIQPSYQQTFTQELLDITVNVGSTAYFYAVLNIDTAEQGLWYRNNVPVVLQAGKREVDSRGRVRDLVIYNTAAEDAGSYTLRIAGVETTAILTVTGAEIVQGLADRTEPAGTDVTLTVRLSLDNVTLSQVRWERYQVRLSNSNKYRIWREGPLHHLTINNFVQSDAGVFTFIYLSQTTSMTLFVSTVTDTNECTLGTHNCHVNAVCSNTVGSFVCTCNQGYRGDGVTCADINECTEGTNNCSPNARCDNTAGSFICTCNSGFTGNGVTCIQSTDVNECATGANNCNVNALCRNTIGSYFCTCNAGYAGDGVTCQDINECAAGTSGCSGNANCFNTPGSYTCACRSGFSGNGFTCTPSTDVNECLTGANNCNANAVCTNTIGSFICTCNAGYSGDGVSCTDVDECFLNTDNCALNAQCTNLIGSFTCRCNGGYSGDGVTCSDINECALGTDSCSPNARCDNTQGSYICTCNAGYSGNGFTCTATSTGVTFTIGLANVTVLQGQTATMQLILSEPNILRGLWYKDGNVVSNTSNLITYHSGRYHYLTVFRAQLSDGGQYRFDVDQRRTVAYMNVRSSGAVDGNWGAWVVVNDPGCGRTCGSGPDYFQSRTRECNNPAPSSGGANCDGPASDSPRISCSFPACPSLIITVPATPAVPAVGGSAIFQVQLNQANIQNGIWVKDTVQLFNSSKTVISVIGLTQQLIVNNVGPADVGTYTYIVGDLRSSATLSLSDSGLSQWTEWSGPDCTASCGGAVQNQFRTRQCVDSSLSCRGETFESRTLVCAPDPCPGRIDGNWGPWIIFIDPDCGITCGTTTSVRQNRTRQCNNPPPGNGGAVCFGPFADSIVKSCVFPDCPAAVNGNWGPWNIIIDPDCGITCGNTASVRQDRTRQCNTPPPSNGGAFCPGSSSDRPVKSCVFPNCPAPTQDLCSNAQIEGGVGYRYHPTDCDKYIQCYYRPNADVIGVYRSCPFGYYWDQRTLRCDEPWKVTCPIERCSGKCRPNYHMSGSCRAYWQCDRGVSIPKCCMSGFMYEEGQGCRPNFFCRDTCPTACADRDVCDKRPDWSGDRAAYNISVGLLGWMATRCVSGAYFNLQDCGCSSLNSTCRAELDVSFNDLNFFVNARRLWLTDDNITLSNGIATFRDNSYFHANINKSTATPNCPVIIKFRYREASAILGQRILLSTSNCKRDNSLVIAIDNDMMTFELMSWYGNKVKLTISMAGYSRYTWKTVSFLYNGYEMIASVERDGAKYFARTYAADSTVLECGLRFGTDGMTNTPNFNGDVDWLTVYMCDPGNIL